MQVTVKEFGLSLTCSFLVLTAKKFWLRLKCSFWLQVPDFVLSHFLHHLAVSRGMKLMTENIAWLQIGGSC